ncbi:MAG: Trp family transcriptional regulator [Patescibacteria group bacterium]
MRTSDRKLNPSLKRQIIRTLAQTFADFKDLKEVETFLTNFFTDSEVETFAKRLAVAYWLKKGRSYSNIKENLKVSSATIAEISSMIDNPGFSLAVKKIEAEEWANQWATKIKKFIGE